MDKGTNDPPQYTTQKTKDRATRTQLTTEGELRCLAELAVSALLESYSQTTRTSYIEVMLDTSMLKSMQVTF
jgi:hypothetical protein